MKLLLPIAGLCALSISSCLKSNDSGMYITDPPMVTAVQWVKEAWSLGPDSGTITPSPDSMTLLYLSPDMKYFVNVNNIRRSEGTYTNDTAQQARTGVLTFSNNPLLSSGRSLPAKLNYRLSGDSIFLETDPIPAGRSTFTFVRPK